jgi:hypothetical protein
MREGLVKEEGNRNKQREEDKQHKEMGALER